MLYQAFVLSLSFCLSSVFALSGSEVFNSLSLSLENAAIYGSGLWRARPGYTITPSMAGESFTLTLSDVYRAYFDGSGNTITVTASDFTPLFTCNAIDGAYLADFSLLSCTVASTIPTTYTGIMEFNVLFSVGGSTYPAELSQANKMNIDSYTVNWDGITDTINLSALTSTNYQIPANFFSALHTTGYGSTEEYYVLPSCSNRYSYGTYTLKFGDGANNINCNTIRAGVSNNFNEWYLAKDNTKSDYIDVVCDASTSTVTINNLGTGPGYRVFLTVFQYGSSTSTVFNNVFDLYYTCSDDEINFTEQGTSTLITSVVSIVSVNADASAVPVVPVTETYTGCSSSISLNYDNPATGTVHILIPASYCPVTYSSSSIASSSSFSTFITLAPDSSTVPASTASSISEVPSSIPVTSSFSSFTSSTPVASSSSSFTSASSVVFSSVESSSSSIASFSIPSSSSVVVPSSIPFSSSVVVTSSVPFSSFSSSSSSLSSSSFSSSSIPSSSLVVATSSVPSSSSLIPSSSSSACVVVTSSVPSSSVVVTFTAPVVEPSVESTVVTITSTDVNSRVTTIVSTICQKCTESSSTSSWTTAIVTATSDTDVVTITTTWCPATETVQSSTKASVESTYFRPATTGPASKVTTSATVALSAQPTTVGSQATLPTSSSTPFLEAQTTEATSSSPAVSELEGAAASSYTPPYFAFALLLVQMV